MKIKTVEAVSKFRSNMRAKNYKLNTKCISFFLIFRIIEYYGKNIQKRIAKIRF
jgi:hypothetical protein